MTKKKAVIPQEDEYGELMPGIRLHSYWSVNVLSQGGYDFPYMDRFLTVSGRIGGGFSSSIKLPTRGMAKLLAQLAEKKWNVGKNSSFRIVCTTSGYFPEWDLQATKNAAILFKHLAKYPELLLDAAPTQSQDESMNHPSEDSKS